MQINRAFPLPAFLTVAAMLSLSACGDVVPQASERAPSHPPVATVPPPLPPRTRAPVPRPPAPPPPPVAPQADWRDVPLPAGDWTWGVRPGGSIARFGVAGYAPVAMLVCDRNAGVVRIALPVDPGQAQSTAPRPATITTSTSSGTVTAEPQAIDGLTTLAITLPASQRLLDAMAFSRGRFRIEIAGLPQVPLPSWSEVGRVVEDCRG